MKSIVRPRVRYPFILLNLGLASTLMAFHPAWVAFAAVLNLVNLRHN